jgi:hypothetical protein
MISILGHSVSDQYAGTLSEMKRANSVARKLMGQPEPERPFYTGKTDTDLAIFRIAEIDCNYDPEWPDQRDVVQLGAHHAREVDARAAAWARSWPQKCYYGGIKKQPAHIRKLLNKFSDRVEPALYAAEKEYDRHGKLRCIYEKIQKRSHSKLTKVEARFSAERLGASQYKRSQIRKQEAQELQAVLDDFATYLQRWATRFLPDRSKLPIRH